MSSATQSAKALRENFRWDVFLSYRSPDRAHVAEVARKLDEMGLKVWWDDREIPPGADYMELMWNGLKSSFATIVFLGPATVGNWQEKEVKAAIANQVGEGKPVLPVFLPGVPDPDKVDVAFLSLNSRAVFESSVTEQRVLNRIYWGITGNNPERPTLPEPPRPAPPRASPTADDGSVAALARWLRMGTVTFFVGPGISEISPTIPPRNWEITCELLREMGLLETIPNHLLPPTDVAAFWYAVSNSDPVLEETVVSLIQGRSAIVPAAHRRLAELIAKLSRREKPRGRVLAKQLILTTNIDLMMERALLRQNLRPARVVQHRTDPMLRVTDYRGIPLAATGSSDIDDLMAGIPDTLVDAATATFSGEPILYKMRGSQDIAGSCALTRPQLLEQARAVIARSSDSQGTGEDRVRHTDRVSGDKPAGFGFPVHEPYRVVQCLEVGSPEVPGASGPGPGTGGWRPSDRSGHVGADQAVGDAA
jgi:hypothetical protein